MDFFMGLMWKPLGFYPARQMARTVLVWLTWSKFSHSLPPILLSVHYYLLSGSSLCTADPRAMLGLAPERFTDADTAVDRSLEFTVAIYSSSTISGPTLSRCTVLILVTEDDFVILTLLPLEKWLLTNTGPHCRSVEHVWASLVYHSNRFFQHTIEDK